MCASRPGAAWPSVSSFFMASTSSSSSSSSSSSAPPASKAKASSSSSSSSSSSGASSSSSSAASSGGKAAEPLAKRAKVEAAKPSADAEGDAAEPQQQVKASGLSFKQEGVQYLRGWKAKEDGKKGAEWKFNKRIQTRLLRHMFDHKEVPKHDFTILLEYLEGLKGGARAATLKQAKDVHESDGDDIELPHRDRGKAMKRARAVLRVLA